jgi:hypothetical protein
LSAVAALTGLATALAAALAWYQSIVWIDVAALAFGAGLAMAIAYWQVRHVVLAALMSLTPLPGLIWTAPLSAGADFGVVPVLAYGFGFALASLYAQHLLDRVLHARDGEAPWRTAAMTLAVAAALVPVWFGAGSSGNAARQAICDAIGASVSVLLLLPLSRSLLQFDEAFVADANRARERRGRLFEWFGGAAVPRWSLSFAGIALVFLALGWFDAAPVMFSDGWRHAVTALVVCAAFGLAAGGWREGIASGIVLAVVGVTAQWWRGYARLPVGAADVLAITLFAALLVAANARRIRHWRDHGDEPATANRRALENADRAVFATVGSAGAALPWLFQAGTGIIVATLLAGGICSALLYPAIVGALDVLVPRRRTVDEVFAKPSR